MPEKPTLGFWGMRGFIRIELLIFIVILSLGALVSISAFLSAQIEARDKKRLVDIGKIHEALALYHQENGYYPISASGLPVGIAEYLENWPLAPVPDGECTTDQNKYRYDQRGGDEDYLVTFCLGKGADTVSKGEHTLTSKGIQ
jgi:type II secretory pathway pseudopilin PulG